MRVVITKKRQEVYRKTLERKSIHKICSSIDEDERKSLTFSLRKLIKEATKELGIINNYVPNP